MKITSQRTLLFRQNITRSNEAWAHFLEGYREELMQFDMLTFGDDWHTAEDIVSEIYLNIIKEPLITNLRPDDSFRHTLITLCKRKHRHFTKPWRRKLLDEILLSLHLTRRTAEDALSDTAMGYILLVEADLMDESRDGARSFKDFSPKDLKRWRTMRTAGEDAKAVDVAKTMDTSPSAFCKSIGKVYRYVVKTVKQIMKRREY